MLRLTTISTGCSVRTFLVSRPAPVLGTSWRSSGSATSPKNQSRRHLLSSYMESSRLRHWIDCCISTPLVQTAYFMMPSRKFLFRCNNWGWWTSTFKISNVLLLSGWTKGRPPAIGPSPRSLAYPKVCSRHFGTSVCFRELSTRKSRPPTSPLSRLRMWSTI